MSKLEVNAVEPQCGTNLTLGASGDTIIIPSGATISNQGTAAGFGPTGAVSWDTTKKTTGFTAVSGVGYFCDTTSAAFTVTLPSSPSAGAVVGIADYANTFATNNITVGRNSSNIGGVAANATLSTNGLSVTFVYVDATQGWIVTDSGNRSDLPTPQFVAATGGTVTCCGNYKIHTFTGPGTFTVTSAGNAIGSNSVDYLVIAGGGSGGHGCNGGGGGGAGGVRESKATGAPWTASPLATSTSLPVSAQGYPITVGGGAPGVSNPNVGIQGTPSVFSTITSTGGGGGGKWGTGGQTTGGSGGGSAQLSGTGGTGNTPPTSPPQGNNGGNLGNWQMGGGGGAGAAGGPGPSGPGCGGPSSRGGKGGGGNGVTTSISGSPTSYGGGGGGGFSDANALSPASDYAPGGTGGGANGGPGTQNGSTNTGGGGGGSPQPNPGTSGAGGSGIVIIRYKYQ